MQPAVALPIAKARCKIADFDQTVPVGPQDKAATFRLALPVGPAQLQTWFYDAQGQALCGALYVYITRAEDR